MNTAPNRANSPLSAISDAEIDDHLRDLAEDPRQRVRYIAGLMAVNARLGLRALARARDLSESSNETVEEAFVDGVNFVVDTLRRKLGADAFAALMEGVTNEESLVEEPGIPEQRQATV